VAPGYQESDRKTRPVGHLPTTARLRHPLPKGVLNRVADALSRQPAAAKDETTPEDLFTLEDAPGFNWYSKMRREVEKNPAAYPDNYIQGDRLHRHFWDMSDSTEPELSDPWKLCVPKPARAAVLRECHDNPTAGYLGIAKTTARLALRYYWPGMFREAAQYVRKCPSCQRYKTPQQQPPGKMYPTPNRQPWETVSTDLVGPLPRSSRGNCYVVVMQGRFTKWVQCRAVRKATARAVTQALYEEVIPRFGCPVTVISDNGTQYSGGTFRTLLLELGIAHRLTRVDQEHASASELWPRTSGTQRRPPPCTRKRRSPLREASLAERHLRARPGELGTRFCETGQVL
jgi:hypothetical protein